MSNINAAHLTTVNPRSAGAVRDYLTIILTHAELLLAQPKKDPAQKVHLDAIRQAAIAAASRLPGRSDITVLVVDDEPMIHQLVQRLLEPTGFTIAYAADAAAALTLAASLRPNVVLCDVHMPGPDGVWLAEQIRTQFPGMAIVFATGDSRISPRHTLSKGVIGYLLKPFDRHQLLATVGEAVRWSTQQRGQASAT